MELFNFANFIYIDVSETMEQFFTLLWISFFGGFFITVVLHFVSFVIFGLFKLIYDISK